VSGTYIVYLGYKAPCLWLRAGNQRLGDAILPGLFRGIYRFVSLRFSRKITDCTDADPEEFDAIFLEADILSAIEADSFWCLAKLLDGIQDNYITAQPGIQRQVKRMCELVQRIERGFLVSWLLQA
jgi:hypothetical protein